MFKKSISKKEKFRRKLITEFEDIIEEMYQDIQQLKEIVGTKKKSIPSSYPNPYGLDSFRPYGRAWEATPTPAPSNSQRVLSTEALREIDLERSQHLRERAMMESTFSSMRLDGEFINTSTQVNTEEPEDDAPTPVTGTGVFTQRGIQQA